MAYNTPTPRYWSDSDRLPRWVYSGENIKPDYAHDEMPIYGERMPDAVVEVTHNLKKYRKFARFAMKTISLSSLAVPRPDCAAAALPYMAESFLIPPR